MLYLPGPGLVVPDVPESPSAEQVCGTVDLLGEMLAGFRFRTEADRANYLGLLLTPLLRELDKLPRDLELPPWVKGRYGSPVGRAVQAVMQTIDLTTGAELASIAASAAQAEDVGSYTQQIIEVVRSALASTTIQRAAGRQHWRETYVGTIVDDTLIEGFVDLLYRDDDGLVVVDFKTDTAISAPALSAYRTQVGVYARAVEA